MVPSYTAALRRYIDEMGLHDAVTFTGTVSDEELVAAMARADVLVMTSRHEGFGVPALEAMSLGLPVVANDAGALPEVVGDAGLLVDARDPYALAGAVARVLGDDDLRGALSAAGRARSPPWICRPPGNGRSTWSPRWVPEKRGRVGAEFARRTADQGAMGPSPALPGWPSGPATVSGTPV